MPPQRAFPLLSLALLGSLALGLGLRADSFRTGLFSDDFIEEAMLQGHYPTPRGALDLFNFVDGTPDEVQLLMDRGALPWWSAPDLQLRMFRPLTSALIGLDRALLGDDALGRHVHSAFWWALGVCAVLWLLGGLLPRVTVAVATLIFALEEAHTLPLSWLANRGALVALALMVGALALHVRAREQGRALPLSPLPLLALGLAAGEWAFPFLGYFVAYELVQGRGDRRARMRALVPAMALGVLYLGLRTALGDGPRGSGVYIDALGQPLQFLFAALVRLPVFLADLVLGVPAHHWDFGSPGAADWLPELEDWRVAHQALGVLALALGVWAALWTRGIRRPAQSHGVSHPSWLALGALLSLLPMVSSFPTSRLVLPAALGVSALAATVAVEAARRLLEARAQPRRALLWAVVLVVLIRVHGLGAASANLGGAAMTLHLASESERWMRAAPIPDAGLEGRHVIQLAASEHTVSLFTPYMRAIEGHPLPRSFWTLSMADSPLRLRRVADDALELTAIGRPFVHTSVERLYRDTDRPFGPGDRITLDGLEVEVLSVVQGRPRSVRFTFEHSLDDPRYLVITCTPLGMRRFRLPEVGVLLQLPHAGFPGL